jgi:hypothetical protein
MKRFAALLVATALSTPALALPTEVEAEYRVTTAGLTIGRVVETFHRDGDAYRIRSTTRSEGILKVFRDDTVTLRSEGRVGPQGLRPLRFEQTIRTDRARDIRAEFDWNRHLLLTDYRGEHSTHALPDGTQDRLSVLYQFMFLTRADPLVSMYMSNGRRVTQYTYRRAEEAPLDTPGGRFDTVRYERVTESERENRAQVWLARDRFNLPVKVVFEDTHGLQLEQLLVSLTTRQP